MTEEKIDDLAQHMRRIADDVEGLDVVGLPEAAELQACAPRLRAAADEMQTARGRFIEAMAVARGESERVTRLFEIARRAH